MWKNRFLVAVLLLGLLISSGCGNRGEEQGILVAPPDFQVTLSHTMVVLQWGTLPDADKYEVYRAEDDADFILLNSSSQCSYVDANITEGVTYTYKVAGVNLEEQGSFTAAVSVVVKSSPGDVAYGGDVSEDKETAHQGKDPASPPDDDNKDKTSPSGKVTNPPKQEAKPGSDGGGDGRSGGKELAPPATVKVFKGFFKNPDYSDPAVFLYSGTQTAMSPDLEKLAKGINDKRDFSTLVQIYDAVRTIPFSETGDKFALTADEITRRGLTGCTDYGLVFAALARYKGIPTVFLQSARVDWVEDLQAENSLAGWARGHILVEVFIDGEWYLVDSTAGKIYLDYDKTNFSIDDGYYVFSKSIEVWDAGIEDGERNRTVMWQLFRNFDLGKYKQPRYHYLDMRNLNIPAQQADVFNPENEILNLDSVLIGDQEPCEAFMDKYLGSRHGMSPSFFHDMVSAASMAEVDIVFFYTKGQWVPPLLEEEFKSEISSSKQGDVIVKQSSSGKKRIFIYLGTNLQENLNLIYSLPSDFEQIGR
jgi:transglutaminase-like putative cysteine protease